MRGAALGLVVGATFGLVYVEANAGALPGPVALVLRLGAAVAYAALLVVLLRRPATDDVGDLPPGGMFTPAYRLVVVAEVIAVLGGNLLLNGPLDLPEGVLPWVTTVVGVHFVALARVWRAPSIGVLGIALAVCGVAGLVLAARGAGEASRLAVAGVVPGLLLLAGSWWAATAQSSGGRG